MELNMQGINSELQNLLENDCKVYIDVYEKHGKDGLVMPIGFVWEDGKRYSVDNVLEIKRAASLKAGGTGLRYTVRIGSACKFMFLEEDGGVRRWFMEKKAS
jgi:hypothetical protein